MQVDCIITYFIQDVLDICNYSNYVGTITATVANSVDSNLVYMVCVCNEVSFKHFSCWTEQVTVYIISTIIYINYCGIIYAVY